METNVWFGNSVLHDDPITDEELKALNARLLSPPPKEENETESRPVD